MYFYFVYVENDAQKFNSLFQNVVIITKHPNLDLLMKQKNA